MSRVAWWVVRIAYCVALVCGLVVCAATPLHAQEPNRAGLVVQFGDGTVVTHCVTFAEDEISGEDVLQRSGLTVLLDYTSGLGARVCKIEDDGCDVPAEDCWCQCQGTSCLYWNYFYVVDGDWRYSGLGSGSRTVRDGDVEGWVWGGGHTPPPLISLDDICGTSTAEQVVATPSPVPFESSATATPPGKPIVAPVSPAATDSTSPSNDEARAGNAGPPTNPSGYAFFIVIALGLGGLGLLLRKKAT